MNEALGTVQVVAGRPVLRFERRLAHPPEKVWRAVTDPDEMAHWFPARVDTELHVGAAMRFRFDDGPLEESAKPSGEIMELDPPKVYAFRWEDSTLRFELVPDGAGCRLVFTHTLAGTGVHGDLASAPRHAAGWHLCLEQLAVTLDGREAPPTEGWFLPLAERYVEEFGAGDGTITAEGDGWRVRFERDLVHPADTVWATLTETDDGTLAVGQAPPVQCTHGYVETGVVTVVEPPRTLAYGWLHDGEDAGEVRLEVRGEEQVGTRLVVTHTIPAHHADLRATVLAAWHTHLELFFAALEGDVRCPWPADRTEHLRLTYARRLENAA